MNTAMPFHMPDHGYNIRCSSTSSFGSSSSSSSGMSSSSSYNPYSPNSTASYDSGYIPNYQMIPSNPYYQQYPPSQPQTFDIHNPEKYMEAFQTEQPRPESFNKYLAPSNEPFSNIDLPELYQNVNLSPVFYPSPLKRGSGRPRIFTDDEKRKRKLESAKKSREKKKAETKQLFEKVNEMKMQVETLKCTEYQFQDCFNDLLRLTSEHLYQNNNNKF